MQSGRGVAKIAGGGLRPEQGDAVLSSRRGPSVTLTLRIFGLELIYVELATDAPADRPTATGEVSAMTTPATYTEALLATDRCDRCGAQAVVRILFEVGELCFCQHHAKRYGFVDELEPVRG